MQPEHDDDDPDAMVNLFMPNDQDGAPNLEKLNDMTSLYELFLTHGADTADAASKVKELFAAGRHCPEINVPKVMDLRQDASSQRWDLRKAIDRAAIRRRVRATEPALIIGELPGPGPDATRTQVEARLIAGFLAEVYQVQAKAGRHYAHRFAGADTLHGRRHPIWELFQSTRAGLAAGPRTSRWMSTAPEILRRLKEKRRTRDPEHPGVAQAILHGLADQLRREAKEEKYLRSLITERCLVYDLGRDFSHDQVMPEGDEYDLPDWDPTAENAHVPSDPSASGGDMYVDTVTGEELPERLVREACNEEVAFMEEWGVGELRPIGEARRVTGKAPVSGKWVVRNKRDHANPLL